MRRLTKEIKKTDAELKAKEPEDQSLLSKLMFKPTPEVLLLRDRLRLLKDAAKIVNS